MFGRKRRVLLSSVERWRKLFHRAADHSAACPCSACQPLIPVPQGFRIRSRPSEVGERDQPRGVGGGPVPDPAAGVDKLTQVGGDPVGEIAPAQVLPGQLSRVQPRASLIGPSASGAHMGSPDFTRPKAGNPCRGHAGVRFHARRMLPRHGARASLRGQDRPATGSGRRGWASQSVMARSGLPGAPGTAASPSPASR